LYVNTFISVYQVNVQIILSLKKRRNSFRTTRSACEPYWWSKWYSRSYI